LSGVAGFVDWRLCGAISRLFLSGLFMGQRDETLMLPVTGSLKVRRVFLFGLGSLSNTSRTGLTGSCGQAIETMRKAGVERVFLGQPAARRHDQIRDLFMDVTSRSMARHISGLVVDPRN
ncbi:MAG: M17 family peptidase N-terminal domain-containing protein, partial [Myxococcota bacterium]|nr:M17 family peptidase N-terminal domain-containing protein [Myxococcota bacterium]